MMKLLSAVFRQKERPVKFVPKPVFFLLGLFLLLQTGLHHQLPGQQARARDLPAVMDFNLLQLGGLGDPVALAKYLMLWLQAFDNQPGISIPFRDLDYERVRDWLGHILRLDPGSQYPLLSASRVYAEVSDAPRKRIMLDFVREEFNRDPLRRWPWMAHAVFVAKHRLKDLDLALEFARELRESVPSGSAPAWARQMEIYILEDMDEIEAAMVLIGGLLEHGQIKDENELRYLKYKLDELKESHKSQVTSN
ncbi:MAG: hypothetical protein MI673_01815 [Thiotrichales bacterium]|nr:hypothetical protein [Thiotrichales bacterium]